MRNKILLIFAFVLSFLAFSETKAQSLLQNGEIPKDLLITLERTGCFGNCPDYKLSVKFNGAVIFNGGYFTKIKGIAAGKISQAKIKQIIAEFETSDFFKLRDSYEKVEDGCFGIESDHQTEIISIQINGKRKRVSHYFGCLGADGNRIKSIEIDSIENLGIKIDEITNSVRWVEPVKSYEEGKQAILREAKEKTKKKKVTKRNFKRK